MKYFNFKDMGKKASYIFRLCLYYFKLESFYFHANIILICAYSFFGMFNLATVFPLVSAALSSSKDLKSGGFIIDNLVRFTSKFSPFSDFFISTVVFASILMLATAMLGILNDIYTGRLVQGINKRVKKEVFKKYLYSDYQFFLDSEHGDLLFKLLTATTNTGAFFLNLMNLVVEILKTILLFVLLLTLSLKATLSIVIVGAVFFVIIFILSRKVSYVIGNAILNVNSRQNIIANEALKGIKHIKVSRAIGLWIRKFTATAEEYYLLKMRNIIFRSLPFRLLEIIAFLLIIGAAVFNRFSSGKNLIDMLPFLSIYGLAIIRVIPSLTAIGDMVMGTAGSFPDVKVVYELLHRKTHSRQEGTLSIGEINDGITFKDVNFGYPGKKPLFEGLNFFIPKNKVTAIVGESGSGKTSIANLLLKIFEPAKGDIMIGGYRLSDISCDSLYIKVSVVSQDTFIFNDTIRNNIDFGLDRPLNEIINASTRAGMHNFIIGLPQGYDTVIGDDGLKLSGGQRQRIAIARALLRDFEILILDEATASLDNKSERVIQDTINAISLNKTVIVIAHRLSTVANADSILVLDKGQVVEKGRHEELLKNEGAYYRLYHRHLEEIVHIG